MGPLSKYILVFSLLIPLLHTQAHGAEQQLTSEAEAFSRVFDIDPEGSPLEKEIFQQFRFGNKDRAAQAAYALRTNTAKESYLAFSEWYLVRWAVASNPNSYLATIRMLMNDTSPDVSAAAIKTASAIPNFDKKLRQQIAQRSAQQEAFRKSIKIGDETTSGLVIEVRKPLVKVQTYSSPPIEKWVKLADISPK